MRKGNKSNAKGIPMTEQERNEINGKLELAAKSLMELVSSSEFSSLAKDQVEDIIDALIDMKC
jgi:hypothetical protein